MLRRLGAGGAGVVFEVYDREQGGRAALKTLQALTPNALLRFKHEFRSLADVRHHNLVRLGELFEDAGRFFFTMEYVEGIDILRWVRRDAEEDEPTVETQRTTATVAAPIREPSAVLERRERRERGERRERPPMPAMPTPRARPDAEKSRFDLPRLRDVLSQLVEGLWALHTAGKVHRDVKPSNVLVDLGGRVVILDFGLVLEIDGNRGGAPVTQVDEVVGTVGYMAPEQAAARPIGPPADWYAVGVILYRALTGRLPFRGDTHEVLVDKRTFEPPPPKAVAPGVPEDLNDLCVELLRIEPAQRPNGADILRRLAARRSAGDDEPRSLPPAPRAAPFVGRDREMTMLEEAFLETRSGKAVTIVILGESGLGKSALARQFGERAAQRFGAIVLHGRCHERESVRFKGVDGVLDALAHVLVKLPKIEVAALLPRRASLLPQTFPVLRRVEAIAEAPAPMHDVVDPKELRSQVFAAVRELLQRLAERRPLVLVIDDLHWSDADSLALLRDVMRSPDAPPLLLIGTSRDGVPPDPRDVVKDARVFSLQPLAPEAAQDLADRLLAGAITSANATTIAKEAGGHPFFIDELVRHNVALGLTETGPTSKRLALDEAIWSRVERLEQVARDIVEVTAVADAPLSQQLIAEAVNVEFGELARRVWTLRLDNLVRIGGVRRSDSMEPYHDRVRASVLAHLSEKTLRAWHERLARVLEKTLEGSGVADCALLALHWKGAGDATRAAKYAEVAAAQAEGLLAFDRAATLYRMALDLLPTGGDAETTRRVLVKLGGALVDAGRGAEAATAFLRASEGASAFDSLDLRRRAAENQLVSGYIDAGLGTLQSVLSELDLKLPKTPRAALASLALRRTQIRLRGLGFVERSEDEVPREVLQRIDLCWAAASALGMVDTIRGADFQTRHLLLALDAGEPFRVLRALTLEAAFSASGGGENRIRTAALTKLAEELAPRVSHPQAPAYIQTGGISAFLEGRWRTGCERLSTSEEFLRERCRGVTFELDSVQLYLIACLLYLGEIRELKRRLPELAKAAKERGDLYASTHLGSGLMTLTRLADEDVENARHDADAAIAQWSHAGTHVAHFLDTQAQAQIDLYVGDSYRAVDRVRARWKSFDEALLLRVQYIRISLLSLWARAALAAATREARPDPVLLDEALAKARALEREHMPWAAGFVHQTRAGVAMARGDVSKALSLLDSAIDAFAAADMMLFVASARRRRGEVMVHEGLGLGEEGSALIDAADGWMRGQDIGNPARLCDCLTPMPRKTR